MNPLRCAQHHEEMRYVTSHTHYGHENIIRFCGRPYADVHHMNVDLVNRAAAAVEPDDELWHLGDVALGYLNSSLTNLARVPGQVTLVAGNHDPLPPVQRGEGRTIRRGLPRTLRAQPSAPHE
jgi:calcineurin-like phosphoesterase family protein